MSDQSDTTKHKKTPLDVEPSEEFNVLGVVKTHNNEDLTREKIEAYNALRRPPHDNQPAINSTPPAERKEAPSSGGEEARRNARVPPNNITENRSDDDDEGLLMLKVVEARIQAHAQAEEADRISLNKGEDITGHQRQQSDTGSLDTTPTPHSVPGAYSGAPGRDLERATDLRFSLVGRAKESSAPRMSMCSLSDIEEQSQSYSIATSSALKAKGLAVAHLLSVTQTVSKSKLPAAEELDTEAQQKRRSNLEKKYQSYWRRVVIVLALLFVMIVAVPIIVVFVSETDSTEQQPASLAPSNSTTVFNLTTTSPALDRRAHLESLLPRHTQLSITALGSPQANAFEWLVNDPSFLNYSTMRLQQRFALATFYYATDGEHWGPNWLNISQHECQWPFFMPVGPQYDGLVLRHSKYKYIEGPCVPIEANGPNDNEEFLHLAMYDQDLRGYLPPELALLTSLHKIQFGRTNVQGSLQADTLTQLTSLRELLLGNTELTGTIPSDLALLTDLQTLVIGANRAIHGQLPTELGLLSNLHTLMVYETNAAGPVPVEYANLNLKELQLFSNALTGRIPSEYGLFSGVDWFGMEKNQLTGPIPSELGNLDSLWLAYLYDNNLSGSIPTELGQFMGDIEQLYLYGNMLTGTIPTELAPASNSVWRLKLNDNQLTGTIPSQLGLLTICSNLALNQNRLSGTIPSEVAAIEPMEYFRVGNNQLTGTIPTSFFGNAGSMIHFWINSTLITGNIPTHIGAWRNLTQFRIDNTQLSGPLPSQLGALQKLEEFVAGSNPLLTGRIPDLLCGLIDDPASTLVFDCGPLCGCHCSCNESSTQSNHT